MAYPNDWSVYPQKQKIEIANKGDIQKVVFTVIPPKNKSEGLITPMVNVNGKFYTDELIEIDYAHIPFQSVLMPSESKIVRLDIKKYGNNIGYIEGAGDVVPESLRQIGYNVTIIKPEQISPENLANFDAIVVGIRAYNIVDELKAEGDWEVLEKYAGFVFDDKDPKNIARTKYENKLYLERPGCNLCMGNQEKAEPGDTVLATSTRLFQGRVVEDSTDKKGESLLSSTPMVVLSTILGRFPTLEEYKEAVDGINLTSFVPPSKDLSVHAVKIIG